MGTHARSVLLNLARLTTMRGFPFLGLVTHLSCDVLAFAVAIGPDETVFWA